MSERLRDLIGDGGVHVLDGAMGTMLYAKGIFVNVCYDELNLTHPTLVREVHEAYVRAGAEIVETNTFGANPVKLSSYGLAEKTEDINCAAARLAGQAGNDRIAVLGAMGPLGVRIEPFGPTGRYEAQEFFRRQVDGLLAGEVDGFILETFSDLDELHAAFNAVRSVSQLPVFAQMTIGPDGNTTYGTAVETLAEAIDGWEVDVIGFNCSVGPAAMLDALERVTQLTNRPLSAQPNAGLPKAVGDRKIYLASPEYMATYARRMISAGARFVGGCCGTTPEHIRTIRDLVASSQPRRTPKLVRRPSGVDEAGIDPLPLVERSPWGHKIASGSFVTVVEMVPPKGWIPTQLIEQCLTLKAAGLDAIHLLDGPRASGRMGAIPSSIIISRDVGLETVVHYSCRDKNMHVMISDLLGAAAAGIRNLVLVTGDPPKTGPYPDATTVFDIDSIGITNLVSRLNRGLDPGGNRIGDPTRYVIGVEVKPGARDRERELSRFAWKVDAGAEFAVTQPVFDSGELERFLTEIEQFRIPIVLGIWPLVSLRNAEFLANEVPGIHVPDTVLARMRRAEERGEDAALAEGVTIARELLSTLRGAVQGVQVSAPYGRAETALSVLQS
jgi:homocysteine S-methyltransferase